MEILERMGNYKPTVLDWLLLAVCAVLYAADRLVGMVLCRAADDHWKA